MNDVKIDEKIGAKFEGDSGCQISVANEKVVDDLGEQHILSF
jgi:hypothetical protein